MKYEIIKGSEKDFEGCNADVLTKFRITGHLTENFSTHSVSKLSACSLGHIVEVIAERRPITDIELKPIYGDGIHDDTEALQQRIDIGIDINNIIGEKGKLFNISNPLQFKPITEPVVNQQLTTEWSGVGLPPVGCYCEVKTGKEQYNLCKVVFSDDVAGVAFVYLGGDEEGYIGSIDCVGAAAAPSYFRVMRLPEDVARDEFIKKSSGELIDGVSIGMQFAAALYDAGYRKTPTVSELMRVTEKATREDCEAIVKMMGGAK